MTERHADFSLQLKNVNSLEYMNEHILRIRVYSPLCNDFVCNRAAREVHSALCVNAALDVVAGFLHRTLSVLV